MGKLIIIQPHLKLQFFFNSGNELTENLFC